MGFGNIEAERKAIEATYEDRCDIIRTVEKEIGNITKEKEATVYKGVCCALSMGNSPTNQTETVNNISYQAKIFMPPEIEIKPGDKIRLTRLGEKTILFENAGEAAVYATHREIMVQRSDRA